MARTLRVTGSAASFMPQRKTLAALRDAAAGCRGCDLYKHGTQTVFGEGRAAAKVRRTSPAIRSSGRPASCSTARWRPRPSTAATCT